MVWLVVNVLVVVYFLLEYWGGGTASFPFYLHFSIVNWMAGCCEFRWERNSCRVCSPCEQPLLCIFFWNTEVVALPPFLSIYTSPLWIGWLDVVSSGGRGTHVESVHHVTRWRTHHPCTLFGDWVSVLTSPGGYFLHMPPCRDWQQQGAEGARCCSFYLFVEGVAKSAVGQFQTVRWGGTGLGLGW